MSISVKKSGSWVAGQGFKLTGTGPGMKAGNVMSGGGGGGAYNWGAPIGNQDTQDSNIIADFVMSSNPGGGNQGIGLDSGNNGPGNGVYAVVVPSSSEWTSRSDYSKYRKIQFSSMVTSRNNSQYFRASIDGGTTWTNA